MQLVASSLAVQMTCHINVAYIFATDPTEYIVTDPAENILRLFVGKWVMNNFAASFLSVSTFAFFLKTMLAAFLKTLAQIKQ